jgi:DNA-binding MarR family transcriptional regulator
MPERLYRVLTRLAEAESPKVTDLARVIDLDRSTISRTVQALTQLGYVQSSTDPVDRRSIDLNITRRGHQTLDKSWLAWQHALVQITSGWTAEERQAFLPLFERFATSFESFIWNGDPPGVNSGDAYPLPG